MNVLLLQTYAVEPSRVVVETLGHTCEAVNYRADGLSEDLFLEDWDAVYLHQGDFRGGDCLSEQVVRRFQRRGATVVWWTYDPPVTKRDIYGHLALAADVAVVCTQSDREWLLTAQDGPRAVAIDHAGIDPAFWRPSELSYRERECWGDRAACAVTGNLYPERQAAIAALRAAGLKVAVWGRGLPGVQWLDTERMRYVYQAVPVNVVQPIAWGGRLDAEYLICRHFEIPATGGFMVCAENAAVRREFPGVPTYRDLDELVSLVAWWSGQPSERARLAKIARARVLAKWTIARFWERMLARV